MTKRVSLTGSVVVDGDNDDGDNKQAKGSKNKNEPSAKYAAAVNSLQSPKKTQESSAGKNKVLANIVDSFPFETEMERRMSQ